MLSHLMNHIHFTYELCNTHNYSIIFKIILTRWAPTVDHITILVAQKLVALKGSYNWCFKKNNIVIIIVKEEL